MRKAMVAPSPSSVRTAWRRPALDQRAALRPCLLGRGRHQDLVCGHDGDHRVGPIREQQDRADEPGVAAELPEGDGSEHGADERERGLHDEAARVGRLPFREQRAVVESKPRRLLGEIDVERCPGEDGGDDQSKLSEDHGSSFVDSLSARFTTRE
jgi:hypothetical protein